MSGLEKDAKDGRSTRLKFTEKSSEVWSKTQIKGEGFTQELFIKLMAKTLIVIIGIVWCEFYAFGLYTIQAQYTDLYPLYLAISAFVY